VRVRFQVSFVLPPGAKTRDARHYLEEAVASWAGSLKPPGVDDEDPDGDPMFSLDRDSIIIK